MTSVKDTIKIMLALSTGCRYCKISDRFLLAVSLFISEFLHKYMYLFWTWLWAPVYTLSPAFSPTSPPSRLPSGFQQKNKLVVLFKSSCRARSLTLYNNLYSYDFRKRETPGKETIITTAFLFSICPYRDTIFVGDRNWNDKVNLAV